MHYTRIECSRFQCAVAEMLTGHVDVLVRLRRYCLQARARASASTSTDFVIASFDKVARTSCRDPSQTNEFDCVFQASKDVLSGIAS